MRQQKTNTLDKHWRRVYGGQIWSKSVQTELKLKRKTTLTNQDEQRKVRVKIEIENKKRTTVKDGCGSPPV